MTATWDSIQSIPALLTSALSLAAFADGNNGSELNHSDEKYDLATIKQRTPIVDPLFPATANFATNRSHDWFSHDRASGRFHGSAINNRKPRIAGMW
jgi:hypothetical protein